MTVLSAASHGAISAGVSDVLQILRVIVIDVQFGKFEFVSLS